MGPEESGNRLSDEEIAARNKAIFDKLTNILNENKEILAIFVHDKDAGIAMAGSRECCFGCLTKYMVHTTLTNYTAHNPLAHVEDIKESVAKDKFEELDGNTRTN